MSQILEKPKGRSPIVKPGDVQHLEKNGLLKSKRKRKTKTTESKPTKANNPSQTPTPEKTEEKKTPKREVFYQTVLRILKEISHPINRADLVTTCIEQNPPKSQRPQWVYNSVIAKLGKKGSVIIDKSKGRLKKDHIISLP